MQFCCLQFFYIKYILVEWTEWEEYKPCEMGYEEAPDEYNFYSQKRRKCFGGKCEIKHEVEFFFCEPINGNWSEWSSVEDEDCFETETGDWVKIANRSCDNPPPLYYGVCEEDHEGNDTKAIICEPSNSLLSK